MNMIPEKLKNGDFLTVIAPSRSLSLIDASVRKIALEKFENLGLNVIYAKNSENKDLFGSASIQDRISDLHDAFLDKRCKAIFTALGGFNSNQLLPFIDWNIIKENPKIFCCFSDITVLLNAIYVKTAMQTYIGPHFSTFGQKYYFDYTMQYVKNILFA